MNEESALLIDQVTVGELEARGLDESALPLMREISGFFQKYPVVPIANCVNSVMFFPAEEIEIIQPMFDQANAVGKIIEHGFNKKAVRFVIKNPTLAPYVLAHSRKEDVAVLMRGDDVKVIAVVILSGTWSLFRKWCVETQQPLENSGKVRKTLEKVFSTVKSSRRLTNFSAMGTVKFSFAHGIDELVSGTAFAVSPSDIFAGTDLGLIGISFDAERFPVLRQSLECSVSGLYSLCYVLGYLYVIGESEIWQIQPRSGERKAMNRPPALKFPTVTDGRYFYSIDSDSQRRLKIAKFVLDGGKFTSVGNLELESSLPVYEAKTCCFATDGAVLSVLPKGSMYQMFSLVNGRYLKSVPCLRPLQAWCIQPYTLDQCILTRTDFTVIQNALHTPRWLEGYEIAPIRKGEDAVLHEVQLCVYHGANLFSDYTNVTAVFNHFLVRKNLAGIYTMGHICVEVAEDLSPSLSYMTDRWHSEPKLRRFLLYVYLSWVARTSNNVPQDNIANLYLEKETDFEIIWCYYYLFDFKRIPLSDLATEKLLTYIIGSWDRFPAQTGHILLAFCANRVRYYMVPDTCEKIIPHFTMILKHIKVNLRMVLNGVMEERWFRDSTQFGILQYLLVLIRKYKEVWFIVGLDFLKMLDFAFYHRVDKMPEISKVLDYALVLFFELLREIPRPSATVTFDSFDKFAAGHPHPLNGVRPDLEATLVSLLNNSHDIHSEDQYASIFFRCRRYLMFEAPESAARLEPLSGKFAAEKLIEYLKTGDIRVVRRIRDPNVMDWVVSVFLENGGVSTVRERHVLALYIDLLADHLLNLTMKGGSDVIHPVLLNTIACIVDKKELLKTKITLKAKEIMDLDVHSLDNAHKNISALFSRIVDGQLFVSRYLAAKDSDFIVPSPRQNMLKSAMLCLIAVRGGLAVNSTEMERATILHIKWGSEKVLSLGLKILLQLERNSCVLPLFYSFAMELVSSYFYDRLSLLNGVGDELTIQTCLFTVVACLKKMFNLNLGFASFLNDFAARVETERDALAVFVILNNTFECIRHGVELHYLDASMTAIVGDCVTYDAADGVVVLKGGKRSVLGRCVLSEAKDTWCAGKALVNLSIIPDLSIYYRLFSKLFHGDGVCKTFMLASFLEFCRLKEFRVLLDSETLSEISNYSFDRPTRIETHYLQFIQFLVLSRIQAPIMSFTSNVQTRVASPNRDCDGILTTMNHPQEFTSAPIHPDSEMKFEFTVACESKVSIHLRAVSKEWNTALHGFTITVDKSKSPTNVTIEFNPETGSIIASVNGNIKERLANSGGVTFYWIGFDMSERSIVQYKVQINSTWRRRSEPFKNGKFFETPSSKTMVPVSDSSVYNTVSLLEAAEEVNKALSQLIYVEVMRENTRSIPDEKLLILISMIHYYPFDEELDLRKMKMAKLWRGYEEQIHEILVSELLPERLRSLTLEVSRKIENSQLFNGRSGLLLDAGHFIICENAFVANLESGDAMSLIGFNRTPLKLDAPACLIPLYECGNSVVIYALHLLHLAMFSVSLEFVDISSVISLVELSMKKLPELSSIIGHLLKLLRVLVPGETVSNSAFLVGSSRVHSTPDKYLASFDVKENLQVIAEQLKNWRPYHSHQLLCAGSFTKEVYDGLPLSSLFSYETASFVWMILSEPPTSDLFVIQQHFLSIDQNTEKKSNLSRAGTAVSFSAWSEEMGDSERSSEFRFYQKLADISSLTNLRMSFLKSTGMNLFASVDASKVRIELLHSRVVNYVVGAKESVAAGHFIKTNKDSNEIQWLKNILLSLDSLVFIQFQEWVTGRWETGVFEDHDNICVFCDKTTENAGTLRSYQPESLIILGTFKDEQSLKRALLQKIQTYEEEYMSSPKM